MSQQTFTLSQDFSDQIFTRFSLALAELKSDEKSDEKLVEGISIYSKVTRDDISALLAAAFWASLSPEEGRYHTFRISFGPPHEFGSNYSLLQPQIYSSEQISDLASVLTNTTRSIGVWYSESGSLEVWGLADFGYWDIKITANRPGQLLFSMLAGETSFEVAISGSWWGFVLCNCPGFLHIIKEFKRVHSPRCLSGVWRRTYSWLRLPASKCNVPVVRRWCRCAIRA